MRKRTGYSHVDEVPEPDHPREHKRAAMVVGVGLSMVVVLAFYALSFRYRYEEPVSTDVPRWALLKDELFEETKPLADDLLAFKDVIVALLNAEKAKASTIEIMKEKITSASDTEATTDYAPEEETREEERR